MIPMPPIERAIEVQSSQATTTSNDSLITGGRIFGALAFFIGIGLTVASEGQAIFYGAILYGFIKMITG